MRLKLLPAISIVLALIILLSAYCIESGRAVLLNADTHAKITVNGAPVSGEVFLAHTTGIVSVGESSNRHSFRLYFAGDTDSTGNMGFVVDCGAWVAPRLPVLLETHEYPPCGKAQHDAMTGNWPLIDKGLVMQFVLQDHSIVAISRSRR